MDIPNTPKPAKLPSEASNTSSASSQSTPPKTTNTAPLTMSGPYTTAEELQIPVGQKILAKVLGEVSGGKLELGTDLEIGPDGRIRQKPLTTEDKAAALLNEKLPQQSSSTAPTKITKEWLIEVAGKYLLTQTDFPLKAGQDIALQGLEGNNLKLLPQPPASVQEIIRQALIRVLPQQVSLQSAIEVISQLAGFKPLSESLSNKLSLSSSGEQQAVKAWAGILKNVIQQQAIGLNNSSSFSDTASNSNIGGAASANQIKQWLERSGLLSEAGRGLRDMQLSPTLSADQARVLQLAGQQIFSPIQKETIELLSRAFTLAGTRVNATGIEQLAVSAGSAPDKVPGRVLTDRIPERLPAEVLNKLSELTVLAKSLESQQVRLSNLLSAMDGRTSTALAPKLQNELGSIVSSAQTTQDALIATRNLILSQSGLPENLFQNLVKITEGLPVASAGDMKSNLVQLVVAMQAALTSTQKTEDTQGRALSESDLLVKAFDFPKMDLSINKASAILADQELNTGQLLKLAAALMNRIQFNQLNSLSQAQSSPDTATQTWNFELPFVTEQQQLATFNLKLEKEQRRNSENKDKPEQQTQWKIVLAFDFEELGPVFIETQLIPPVVKSRIWADKEDTAKLFQAEQSVLQEKLSKLGLEVEELSCLRGKPRAESNPIKRNLVDIQA